jgi:hypothetical protein
MVLELCEISNHAKPKTLINSATLSVRNLSQPKLSLFGGVQLNNLKLYSKEKGILAMLDQI